MILDLVGVVAGVLVPHLGGEGVLRAPVFGVAGPQRDAEEEEGFLGVVLGAQAPQRPPSTLLGVVAERRDFAGVFVSPAPPT